MSTLNALTSSRNNTADGLGAVHSVTNPVHHRATTGLEDGRWATRSLSAELGESQLEVSEQVEITFKKNPLKFLKKKFCSCNCRSKKKDKKDHNITDLSSSGTGTNIAERASVALALSKAKEVSAAAVTALKHPQGSLDEVDTLTPAFNNTPASAMYCYSTSTSAGAATPHFQPRGSRSRSRQELGDQETKGDEETKGDDYEFDATGFAVRYVPGSFDADDSDDELEEEEALTGISLKPRSRTALSFRVGDGSEAAAVILKGPEKVKFQSKSVIADIQAKFVSERESSSLREHILARRCDFSEDLESSRVSYGFPSVVLGKKDGDFGVYLGAYPMLKVVNLNHETETPVLKGNRKKITSFVKICEQANKIWLPEQRAHLEREGFSFYDFTGKETHGMEFFRNQCSSLSPEELDKDVELWFDDLFRPFDDALLRNKHVWVHCVNGENRSPALLIIWLINRFDLSYEEAYEFLQVCRPGIRPMFPDAIKKYAAQLKLSREIT